MAISKRALKKNKKTTDDGTFKARPPKAQRFRICLGGQPDSYRLRYTFSWPNPRADHFGHNLYGDCGDTLESSGQLLKSAQIRTACAIISVLFQGIIVLKIFGVF